MELFGRTTEVNDVLARLADRRLVSLVGPGGIGKTSIARAAAAALRARDGAEVLEVDLTRIDSSAAIDEVFASQLGYTDFGALVNAQADRARVIVVDNCEHVLDAAATTIDRLLEGAPEVRVLGTTRSPLNTHGESIIAVGPLALPDSADTSSGLREEPAVRLFIARCRDHGFDVSDTDVPAVADVCRLLDGVPLALELAAARSRTVGLDELIDELTAAPHALARRGHRGQPNHRSVGEVVEWSVQTLTESRRLAFERLSVFSGPFSRALARAVAGHEIDEWDDVLDDLVDASLVVVDRSTDGTQYRLLHLVRAVAAARLTASGEEDPTRMRLVDEVTTQLAELAMGDGGSWQPGDLHRLLTLHNDALAAVRWTLDNDDTPDRALVLLAVLWGVIHNSPAGEIHRLGEQVLTKWPESPRRLWLFAVATVATCRFLDGDTSGATELANRGLERAEQSAWAAALLWRVVGQSARADGRVGESRAMFERAAAAARQDGAAALAMELEVDVGLALVELGFEATGVEQIDAVIAEATESNSPINLGWALAARAAALARSDTKAAGEGARVALAKAREIGYPAGVTSSLRTLAICHVEADELAEAATVLDELLSELLRRSGADEMRAVFDLAAVIARRRGDARWGDLSATASAMPVTSFIQPTELMADAHGLATGVVLSSRESHVLCREVFRAAMESVTRTDDQPALASGTPDAPSMEREGDVWRMTFGGKTIRVKHSKGVGDLATLLASPGKEILALDLMGGGAADDAGSELLDAQARREYEARVLELQADLEEAENNGDIGSAESARVELDALIDQLTAAVGLGGRSRQTTTNAERARSAVTQRLRNTIKKIEILHPKLGRHLRLSTKSGAFCTYAPESSHA